MYLDEPWLSCFQLAWESFQAGSVPIGAVIVDHHGAILTRGRNRRFESGSPVGQLANTNIAHAEINALASLPPGDYTDCVLYTTIEPCLLCSAAMAHQHVGHVRYAGADPALGEMERVPEIVQYLRGRWPIREGPLDGSLARIAACLTLVFWLRSNPTATAVRAAAASTPDLLAVAKAVVGGDDASTLRQLPASDGYQALDARLRTV